jgi:hypothetical protein
MGSGVGDGCIKGKTYGYTLCYVLDYFSRQADVSALFYLFALAFATVIVVGFE